MEALTAFITNPSAISLIFILLVIVILYIAAKKGIISYNAHGVKFGDSDDRILIRNQIEYIQAACEGQFRKIRPYCESDDQAKYIISKVEDVFQACAIYNYITDEECYVRAKKNLVLMTIQKRVNNDHFFTPEFRSCCDKFTEDLIKDLYHMKTVMKG